MNDNDHVESGTSPPGATQDRLPLSAVKEAEKQAAEAAAAKREATHEVVELGPSGLPHDVVCGACGRPVTVWLPCSPVFSLRDVVGLMLLPNVDALVSLIGKNKDKFDAPLYRTVRHRRMRYLRLHEVKVVRDLVYQTRRYKGYRKLVGQR